MKTDWEYLIIGGGVAGLCAAIRLTELGIDPLLIEAGNYPSHKVCGEFFSPNIVQELAKWDIFPIEVKKVRFYSQQQQVEFNFPKNAGSMSHFQFDSLLVNRAIQGGAEIRTNTKVNAIHKEKTIYNLSLSTGEVIHASNLIIATGRIPNLSSTEEAHKIGEQVLTPTPSFPYVGIKAHYSGLNSPDFLQMFAFDRAYVGVSPIEESKYNVACLAEKEKVRMFSTPDEFMYHLMSQNRQFGECFKKGKLLFDHWMHVPIPNFGMKETPNWTNAYFIGDSMASIPPITGNGLSIAITSGRMAAEYAKNKEEKRFKAAIKKAFKRPIFFGKRLHVISLSPLLSSGLIRACNVFSLVKNGIFKLTR